LSEDEAVFTPSEFVVYIAKARKVEVGAIKVPRRVLMTYQRTAYEYAKRLIVSKLVDWWIYGPL
jgi:hypothetical protein